MIKIAFFDTKEYDKKLFDEYNKKYGYEITYLESRLNSETAPLAKGFDVVCIFVNDVVDEKTIKILEEDGVKLIALRCAGFNNVDIKKIGEKLKVVRVPAYSPYAVAEHAVALLLSIDRKIYKAYQRTKKYNFTLNGLLGFDIHGKTVGVIGSGKIGKVFINIMNGFGCRVLAYDKLKKEYKPENADPIKSKYKKQATKEELKQYFRVWYKQFLKHPDVYVEAFISNTYHNYLKK